MLLVYDALAADVEKALQAKQIPVAGSTRPPPATLDPADKPPPEIKIVKFEPLKDAPEERESEDPAAQDNEDPAQETDGDSDLSESGPALTTRWISMDKGQTHLFKEAYPTDAVWVIARGLQCNRRLGAASKQGQIPKQYPPADRPWCSSCSLKAPKGFFNGKAGAAAAAAAGSSAPAASPSSPPSPPAAASSAAEPAAAQPQVDM